MIMKQWRVIIRSVSELALHQRLGVRIDFMSQ